MPISAEYSSQGSITAANDWKECHPQGGDFPEPDRRRAQLQVKHSLSIIREAGAAVPKGSSILDLGCGRGFCVEALLSAGFDAFGTDIEPYWNESTGNLAQVLERSRLRLADLKPYRLPFEDERFDCVISNQVFEHVMPSVYVSTLQETTRVLKKGGVSLHIYPARWKPIESHVFVPFGSVLRSEWYLKWWALCGIRNGFQKEDKWKTVAEKNRQYLISSTHYPTVRTIKEYAGAAAVAVQFVPHLYFKYHPGRTGKWIKKLPIPGLSRFAAVFSQRAMIIRRVEN